MAAGHGEPPHGMLLESLEAVEVVTAHDLEHGVLEGHVPDEEAELCGQLAEAGEAGRWLVLGPGGHDAGGGGWHGGGCGQRRRDPVVTTQRGVPEQLLRSVSASLGDDQPWTNGI